MDDPFLSKDLDFLKGLATQHTRSLASRQAAVTRQRLSNAQTVFKCLGHRLLSGILEEDQYTMHIFACGADNNVIMFSRRETVKSSKYLYGCKECPALYTPGTTAMEYAGSQLEAWIKS